jgi:DNA integrity scanning protein DisA with diadenylate cyclase activity
MHLAFDTKSVNLWSPSMPAIPSKLIEDIDSICWETNTQTCRQVLSLALEIAREGREGRKIGTIFTIGDHEAVLEASRCIILDPLKGHSDSAKHIDDPNLRETIKELAQLDGGFVVSDAGVVISAARYFNSSSKGVDVPLGLGSRHIAGASVSRHTDAISVVVSQSSVVRIFYDGCLVSESHI